MWCFRSSSSPDEAAGVPQRVRMHPRETGAFGPRGDQVVDGLTGERLPAFGGVRPTIIATELGA